MVNTEQIKELRQRTGISVAQCKTALEEAGGDMAKALEALKAKGAEIAEKKASRELHAGTIQAYVHAGGAIASLVQLSSESDFVAKHPDFIVLAQDLAMQISACEPQTVVELLSQPYIKDPNLSVDDLIKQATQKFGERLQVERFVRFSTADNLS